MHTLFFVECCFAMTRLFCLSKMVMPFETQGLRRGEHGRLSSEGNDEGLKVLGKEIKCLFH